MNNISQLAFDLTEQGMVPDAVTRRGIRLLLKQRLREIKADDSEQAALRASEFVSGMEIAPIAVATEKANEQHYELPAEFFQMILGPKLKYSCSYWPSGVSKLSAAEEASLAMTCSRARLRDGLNILELGCGWGALTLWVAKRFPGGRITAVSNSNSQRAFIEERAKTLGIRNIDVITADMNNLKLESGCFDRVVSVEMFEHMRNWPALYERISGWLKPGGLFFKHIFVNRSVPYLFEDKGESDWMSRHFFTGGMMPSDDLALFFQTHLKIVNRWRWNGQHYEKTANAWLVNMDQQKDLLWPLFQSCYGDELAQTWWHRWRLFFMACAELFGYQNGQQWWVSHYLFEKPKFGNGA